MKIPCICPNRTCTVPCEYHEVHEYQDNEQHSCTSKNIDCPECKALVNLSNVLEDE